MTEHRDNLTAECSRCGGGIESAGTDETSFQAVAAWVADHATCTGSNVVRDSDGAPHGINWAKVVKEITNPAVTS
jgi:hypothetical protein